MIGGSGSNASSPEKILKICCILVHFGAFWCIFLSDCVLKNSPKINVFLYKTFHLYKK